MPHARHARPNAVDGIQVVGMNAQHRGAAMFGHVDEVLSRQTIVDRHNDRPELRYRVELLEMLMRVGRYRRDAVTLAHAQFRECTAPSIVSLAKLGVSKAQFAVDHGLALAMQLACAARELEGRQWRFHTSESLPDSPRPWLWPRNASAQAP